MEDERQTVSGLQEAVEVAMERLNIDGLV